MKKKNAPKFESLNEEKFNSLDRQKMSNLIGGLASSTTKNLTVTPSSSGWDSPDAWAGDNA
jgi:hypothetical protein